MANQLAQTPSMSSPWTMLLETGFRSDAEIQLGDRTWKVHQCVVCLPGRSKYFEAAFKTGGFEEGTTTKLVLEDDGMLKENDVDGLLKYLYSGGRSGATCDGDLSSIEVKKICEANTDGNLDALIGLWLAGDYFQVSGLQKNVPMLQDSWVKMHAKLLCAPGPVATPNVNDTSATMHVGLHVMRAIERLDNLSKDGNLVVVDKFKPLLLRLVFCGRHAYPLESLLNKHPEFFKGWEFLMDEKDHLDKKQGLRDEMQKLLDSGMTPRTMEVLLVKRLADSMELYPPTSMILCSLDKTCWKCNTRFEAGGKGWKEILLDHVSWANTGSLSTTGIQWLCTKCYSLPSLEEWELVKRMHLAKQGARKEFEDLIIQRKDIKSQMADLMKQNEEIGKSLVKKRLQEINFESEAKAQLDKLRKT